MNLNILKIIYNKKKIYIIFFSGDYTQFRNGFYFPRIENEKFCSFECLNETKKIISEINIEYDKKLKSFINIDNIISWLKNDEVRKINLEELMDFNSYIYSYISYKYDGVLPQEFIKNDFKGMEKVIQVYLANELMKQCLSINNPESKMVAYIKELKVVSSDGIKQILNSPELKKDVEILLNFFKAHIIIIKSKVTVQILATKPPK